jgi:hypothetical protein
MVTVDGDSGCTTHAGWPSWSADQHCPKGLIVFWSCKAGWGVGGRHASSTMARRPTALDPDLLLGLSPFWRQGICPASPVSTRWSPGYFPPQPKKPIATRATKTPCSTVSYHVLKSPNGAFLLAIGTHSCHTDNGVGVTVERKPYAQRVSRSSFARKGLLHPT